MDEALRAKLRQVGHSPELFLRDIDPLRDAVVLSPMTEATYRASSFLDNRLVRAGERDLGMKVGDLERLLESQQATRRPIHWLFHVGHCGSTLIARLLGETDGLFALREPPVLMGLTRSARRLDEPGFPIDRTRWDALKDLALILLGRTWRESETALVKATSDVVNLAPALLRHTGEGRGILLYVDLETFIATMLRPHTRRELVLFGREFRVRDFAELTPGASIAAADYSDGRLAALTWLLHVRRMAAALDDPALAPRLLALSFDAYLAAPAAGLAAMAGFLGQDASAERIAGLLESGAAIRYAKDPALAYDANRRAEALAAVRGAHAAEIADALAWAADTVAATPALAGLIDRFSRASPGPAPH